MLTPLNKAHFTKCRSLLPYLSSIRILSKILKSRTAALTALDTGKTVNLSGSNRAGKTTHVAFPGIYYYFSSGMQLANAPAFLLIPHHHSSRITTILDINKLNIVVGFFNRKCRKRQFFFTRKALAHRGLTFPTAPPAYGRCN